MSFNLFTISLILHYVLNRFINVTVDFIVYLFLFLSLSCFKSVFVAAMKALVKEVWSVVPVSVVCAMVQDIGSVGNSNVLILLVFVIAEVIGNSAIE